MNPVLMLPASLVVEEEVLGESFAVKTGPIHVELTFPIRNGTDDWPRLVAPSGPHQDVHDQLVVAPARWGHGLNDSWEVWAVTASMLVSPGGNPAEAPEVSALSESLDQWFLGAREWILARHGVPRTGLNYSRGTAIAGVDSEGRQWGAGAVIGAMAIAGLRGGSIAEVRAAFDRATLGKTPPLQNRLLVDARTAAIGGDGRRAVIDAGTASEVSLAAAIRAELGGIGVKSNAVEAIISQANGLVGLISLFESFGRSLAVSKRRASDVLADKRNRAAHGGVSPTKSETSAAVQCAIAIVASATPLSFP